MLKKIDPYFRIPSKAPFAWTIYLVLLFILASYSQIYGKNLIFWLTGWFLLALLAIQIVYNVINLFNKKKKSAAGIVVNLAINIGILFGLFFAFGVIAGILNLF